MSHPYRQMISSEHALLQIELGNGTSIRSAALCLARMRSRCYLTSGASIRRCKRQSGGVDMMNARPRQQLGWKTPHQALEKEVARFNAPVALTS